MDEQYIQSDNSFGGNISSGLSLETSFWKQVLRLVNEPVFVITVQSSFFKHFGLIVIETSDGWCRRYW